MPPGLHFLEMAPPSRKFHTAVLIVTRIATNAPRAFAAMQQVYGMRQENQMSPAEFKAWRKSLGLKQKEAAEKLGLKKRMIQYYETGKRGGKKVVIPKTVELACYSLSVGVEAFDGNGRS